MDSDELDARFSDDEMRSAFNDIEYGGGPHDFSEMQLENLHPLLLQEAASITTLHFTNNLIKQLPPDISSFVKLVRLDLSNNFIHTIHPALCQLKQLKMFSCRNNHLTDASFPKDFSALRNLEYINVSSNHLTCLPPPFLLLSNLRRLYVANNQIDYVSPDIQLLSKLEVLYLGGNQLQSLPSQLGLLRRLTCLVLADNFLTCLPTSLALLHNLKCLSLHNNRLSTLPPEIIRLDLLVMSLRGNPLVLKFAQNLSYEPPSLLELSARVVKVRDIKVQADSLPSSLLSYLSRASQCVNPKCKGVYFSSKVEQIKFVDFCGLYRLPLLHYLCSPQCSDHPSVPYSSSESESDDDNPAVHSRVRKVLLG